MKKEASVVLAPLDVAATFKALGDPTRLRIFEFLSSCCSPVAVEEETGDVRPVDGPTVGEVCCRVTGAEKITSTVSFHLKELRNAGLITMEKRGKNVVCSVNPDAVRDLKDYLSRQLEGGANNECCR
jgi:ArsR family transcriptional regulator, arsenate/arsenite/antimonite-responsive transcriptional repressor